MTRNRILPLLILLLVLAQLLPAHTASADNYVQPNPDTLHYIVGIPVKAKVEYTGTVRWSLIRGINNRVFLIQNIHVDNAYGLKVAVVKAQAWPKDNKHVAYELVIMISGVPNINGTVEWAPVVSFDIYDLNTSKTVTVYTGPLQLGPDWATVKIKLNNPDYYMYKLLYADNYTMIPSSVSGGSLVGYPLVLAPFTHPFNLDVNASLAEPLPMSVTLTIVVDPSPYYKEYTIRAVIPAGSTRASNITFVGMNDTSYVPIMPGQYYTVYIEGYEYGNGTLSPSNLSASMFILNPFLLLPGVGGAKNIFSIQGTVLQATEKTEPELALTVKLVGYSCVGSQYNHSISGTTYKYSLMKAESFSDDYKFQSSCPVRSIYWTVQVDAGDNGEWVENGGTLSLYIRFALLVHYLVLVLIFLPFVMGAVFLVFGLFRGGEDAIYRGYTLAMSGILIYAILFAVSGIVWLVYTISGVPRPYTGIIMPDDVSSTISDAVLYTVWSILKVAGKVDIIQHYAMRALAGITAGGVVGGFLHVLNPVISTIIKELWLGTFKVWVVASIAGTVLRIFALLYIVIVSIFIVSIFAKVVYGSAVGMLTGSNDILIRAGYELTEELIAILTLPALLGFGQRMIIVSKNMGIKIFHYHFFNPFGLLAGVAVYLFLVGIALYYTTTLIYRMWRR